MINKSIDDLFDGIYNSSCFKEYIKIKKVIEEDDDINTLVEEIKSMQKKATYLQYHKDNKYIKLDKEIKDKLDILNSNVLYQEYLNKTNDLNEVLNIIKSVIEEYINKL